MSKKLKRVPLDFNWPLNKIWKGYVNPHYDGHCRDCEACATTGYSPEAKKLKDQWYGYSYFKAEKPLTVDNHAVRKFAERNVKNSFNYYQSRYLTKDINLLINYEADRLINMWNGQWSHHLDADDVKALIDADRLWDFTRVPINEEQKEIVRKKIEAGGNSWLPESNGYIPTPEEVNNWNILTFGHDSINCWVCVKAKAARLGFDEDCPVCKGKGSIWDSEENRIKAEEWEEEEPPIGDGYQLWETTSEGSPVSPVFATLKELCIWAEKHAHTFVTATATRIEWYRMLSNNFVYHEEGNNIFI